jgi:hypothetical protein
LRSSPKFVVESEADVAILSRLIPACYTRDGATYLTSGENNSVRDAGLSVLAHEDGPVMAVVNAETLSLYVAAGNFGFSVLRTGEIECAYGPDFDMFVFLPQIDVVFFEAPDIFESVDVPESRRWKDHRLHAEPRKELQEFLGDLPLVTWVESLSEDAWAKVREGRQAKALIEAVDRLLTREPLNWRRQYK